MMLGSKTHSSIILENGCLNKSIDSFTVEDFRGADILNFFFEGKKVWEICCDDFDGKSSVGYKVDRKYRMISFWYK